MKLWLYSLLAICITACNSSQQDGRMPEQSIKEVVKQPVGTVVAVDSMAILPQDYSDLQLASGSEKPSFIVKVKTTEHTSKGTYAVEATWGANVNDMQFSMPRGAEDAIPVLRRQSQPYAYIIGFYYGDDTTFYDYYSVKGSKDGLNAKYEKAYLFQ
jgi:hypothetical protein